MRTRVKTAILAALAVLTMAALIYINLQHARTTGPRTSASAPVMTATGDSFAETSRGSGEAS